MLDLDQDPVEVIFNWRYFLFNHPILPLDEQITSLEDSNLFPLVYGLSYVLPNRMHLILLDPAFREKRMKWFFPLSPRYWAPRDLSYEIYSTDILSVDQDARTLLGDQRLICPCKFYSFYLFLTLRSF